MQKNKINILSTRPVGTALISKAAQHDISIDEISFINTEEIIDDTLAKKIEHLSRENINAVFTSMNAVEAVRKFIPLKSAWKVFCIGNTTKKLVKDIFGESNLSAIGNNATELAENIVSDKGIKKIYFFCGDQRRDELPEKLKDNSIEIEELVVYKTIETAEKISKVYDGILFFSPSAVDSFFLKNFISNQTKVFAIGTTTADALKPFTQHPVIIADFPGKKNLVEQAINYFSKKQVS